jgi:hypothetical protein
MPYYGSTNLFCSKMTKPVPKVNATKNRRSKTTDTKGEDGDEEEKRQRKVEGGKEKR